MRQAEAIRSSGFDLERHGSSWLVTGVPAMLSASDSGGVILAIRERRDSGDMRRALCATTACRAAVKDGDEVDEAFARALFGKSLGLGEPRCPHGRPIWVRLDREGLFKAVLRIVD